MAAIRVFRIHIRTTLSKRAHKNVVVSDIEIDVCINAFDILYLNGQPLFEEQLNVRRESYVCGKLLRLKHLFKSFEEEAGFPQFATATTSNDIEEIQNFLETAIDTRILGFLRRSSAVKKSVRSQNMGTSYTSRAYFSMLDLQTAGILVKLQFY
ncbi:DNA ligase, ATP-dependent, central [Dillenia turbinata]|uniref:DNA ligase, ATP-dependent, central n=1 Tax=Dillenia turbinata TaxID=194707 RepID=A0AAN8VXQ4_9MAGN